MFDLRIGSLVGPTFSHGKIDSFAVKKTSVSTFWKVTSTLMFLCPMIRIVHVRLYRYLGKRRGITRGCQFRFFFRIALFVVLIREWGRYFWVFRECGSVFVFGVGAPFLSECDLGDIGFSL